MKQFLMKQPWLLPLACFCFLLPSAHAQLGLYGGFSAANTNIANEPWFYGGTFGAYYNVVKLPLLKVGLDGRAAVLNGTATVSQRLINGLGGLRAEVHVPLIPLKPYVSGYVGGTQAEIGQGVARSDQLDFSYGFAGGADLTIFPRLDWRVAEYAYTRTDMQGGFNQSTLTTGLVLRLPIP